MKTYLVVGIIILVIVVLILWIIKAYNNLIQLRNRVKDQWSQVDVQLKKRFDLISNLIETVKGYTKYEQDTLEGVIKARNSAINAKIPEDEIEANNELTGALNRLFALSEAYPELKADSNFINLQQSLKEVEDKISFARQFYNDTVLKYKNAIEMFPTVLVAKAFGFEKEKFFEVDNSERENVKVKF